MPALLPAIHVLQTNSPAHLVNLGSISEDLIVLHHAKLARYSLIVLTAKSAKEIA